MRRPIPFILLVLLGIGFDLLTKWLAFRALSPKDLYVIIPDVLVFVHAENHGVAFSMFADKPWFILTVTSAAVVFLAWLYSQLKDKAHGLVLVAINLLLIGATGNLIDRVFLGYVRDFIDFVPQIPVIGHWAVFNVADVCITVGVILYAIAELFLQQPPDSQPQEATTHSPSALPQDH